MTTIANAISSQTALAQAQAKLAADQAAKAAADILKADQKAVDDASQQGTAQSTSAPSSTGVVDISA